MPPVVRASLSRWRRQYVLSQPLGKTSKESWPPMEKLRTVVSQAGRREEGEKRDERQPHVLEALAQVGDHLPPHAELVVVGEKVEALLLAGVTTNGGDVDHAVAEFDKGAALDRDGEVGNVVENVVDEFLVGRLAQPLDEAGRGQRRPVLEGRQSVLGEAEVEHGRHGHVGRPELFLLLGQVRSAHVADGALLTDPREEVEHLGGCPLAVR